MLWGTGVACRRYRGRGKKGRRGGEGAGWQVRGCGYSLTTWFKAGMEDCRYRAVERVVRVVIMVEVVMVGEG